MAKKRTKKEKQIASLRHVNTQFNYTFNRSSTENNKTKDAVDTDKNSNLGSIKKDLFKSLFIAILLLISLVVVYWFSK